MRISESLFFIFDIAVIAVYLLCMISAYRKGFIFELVSLVSLIVSIFAGFVLAPVLADKYPLVSLSQAGYTAMMLEPYIDTVLYFVIVFVILRIVYFLLSPIFKSISKIPFLGFFNRILGILMGFINATITIAILSTLLLLPIFDNGLEVRNKTLIKQVNAMTDQATRIILENVDMEKIARIDIKQAEDITISFWEWFESLGE